MDEIKEIISTLGMLAKAQSSLCLLGSSWLFTIAWVFAAERKKGAASKPLRAWLGVFWLPGLFVYYVLPDVQATPRRRLSPTLHTTPKTAIAPGPTTPERHRRAQRRDQVTSDGTAQPTRNRSASRAQAEQMTDDGTGLNKHDGVRSPRAGGQDVSAYQLRVLNGALKDHVFPLKSGKAAFIGSGFSNDIRLRKDEGVAGWHAVINWQNRDCVLEDPDNHEHHDIIVNNSVVKVKKRPLREGDILKLGRTELRFERTTRRD